jgi:hypothetical protein
LDPSIYEQKSNKEENSQAKEVETHLNSITCYGENVPIIYIDVNISPSETKRLSIYRGDTADKLA